MFRKRKQNAVVAPTEGSDDLVSPLEGQSLINIVIKIAVAIAIPGGLYVLAALVILPALAKLFLRRADKRASQGSLDQAIRHASRAVTVSRGSATARARRGLLLLENGDREAAMLDVEKAIKKNANNPLPYFLRARVHDAADQPAKARADYARFLELRGEDHEEYAGQAVQRLAELGDQ